MEPVLKVAGTGLRGADRLTNGRGRTAERAAVLAAALVRLTPGLRFRAELRTGTEEVGGRAGSRDAVDGRERGLALEVRALDLACETRALAAPLETLPPPPRLAIPRAKLSSIAPPRMKITVDRIRKPGILWCDFMALDGYSDSTTRTTLTASIFGWRTPSRSRPCTRNS